jgi:DNA uptake protein ComE-like DNA-binding protein
MAQLGDRPETVDDAPTRPTTSTPEPIEVSETLEPQSTGEPIVANPPMPVPVAAPIVPSAASVEPPSTAPVLADEAQTESNMAFNLNTCTADDLIKNIPGCSQDLAESIIRQRSKIGTFKRLEELLDVPGMTKDAYTSLTGETPPANHLPLSLNEILGFPPEQQTSLKDVTDRISCWPDITGCVLSQNSGLSLVGTVPPAINKEALVAFAPRMFDALNKSFSELAHRETDALIIPTAETSFHLFRNNDLYLIIMSRLPQMPERHVKVARIVLAALSSRRD